MEEKNSSSMSGSQRTQLGERSAGGRPPVPKPAPWLVFQHGKGMKYHAFYDPCEPNNKTCTKFIPELSGKIYWQKPCFQGWLVILDIFDEDACACHCFLWNPVSMESVKLPNLFQWLTDYHFYNCVLTLPMSNNIKESMVYFLLEHHTTSENLLVYSHPGAKQWQSKCLDEYYEDLSRFVRSFHYLKGKLYILCYSEWHIEIEINQQQQHHLGHDHHYNDQTLSVRRFQVKRYPYLQHAAGSTTSLISHHVESFDDIFRVNIFFSLRNMNKPYAPASILQVLKLDFSLMAWVEVRSLGDDVLFIGRQTRAFCSAADMALKRGCVFYTLPNDKSLYIFEVEDDGITVVLPFSKLPTPWFSGDWIMIPTPVRRSGGRRGIENLLGRDDKEEDYKIIELADKLNKACIEDYYEEAGQDIIHNGGELEEVERTPWSIISNDIVELIASYLNPKDFAQLRSICRRNRSIFPEIYPSRASLFPLLVFNSFEDNTGTIYNFLDPMHNEMYSMKKNLSELLAGATIRFSKYGWLLLVSNDMKTPFFYNPFTKVMIRLPDFPNVNHRLYLSGMSFSSPPTSPDCVVFAIEQIIGNIISIYAIKRGSCYWRSRVRLNSDDSFVPCFNNSVFFQGDFFCLDYAGTLGRCVVYDEDKINTLGWVVYSESLKQFNGTFPSYLVECNGQLLTVNVGRFGKPVGVFSLDWAKKVWVKVKNLGEYMLFISNTSSFSAIAPPNSRMENKIYFPRLQKDGRGLLFYSLDTGKYHYSHGRRAQQSNTDAATDFYDAKEMCNSTWIEPDWSQSTPTTHENHFNWSA
ncbi:uncharacterized protein LOC113349430 [Papaver somniferum]|uniref:uncharacterized protein LOC113349430 n=1 Tax=Papaver somniferum TaxID=3469 RepID=UPI000E6F4DE5|nr:uncharacterized protein LOC113349430 [Papaver somniferum]